MKRLFVSLLLAACLITPTFAGQQGKPAPAAKKARKGAKKGAKKAGQRAAKRQARKAGRAKAA